MNLLLFVLIPLFRYKHCIYNIQWVNLVYFRHDRLLQPTVQLLSANEIGIWHY